MDDDEMNLLNLKLPREQIRSEVGQARQGQPEGVSLTMSSFTF
jgi:hypothetical protein